jgi:hypothetical protein
MRRKLPVALSAAALLVLGLVLTAGRPSIAQPAPVVWLDPQSIELKAGESAISRLANLTSDSLNIHVELIGSTGFPLGVAGSTDAKELDQIELQFPLNAGQDIEIEVSALEDAPSGSATLVAWGARAYATREVVLQAAEAATPVLPSTLTFGAGSNPMSRDDSLSLTLPEAVLGSEDSACPTAGGGGIVGRISGPDGEVADVCVKDQALAIYGATESGTWSGDVDLLPDNEDAGDLILTLSVRDRGYVPFAVLLFALAVAYIIPLEGVRRNRQVLVYRTNLWKEDVDHSQRVTLRQLQDRVGPGIQGIDRIHASDGDLYLDAQAWKLLTDYDTALSQAERDAILSPTGPLKDVQTLVGFILNHFDLIRLTNLRPRTSRMPS